ncbi:MAG TPA: radical SAM/SPASM domain-containing protein [Candidatus Margulisiibacteriota bacterium]|nr:radical SAM/SPASM domain-containing protein [Candidatus Margulisiibacteriota bacterium]
MPKGNLAVYCSYIADAIKHKAKCAILRLKPLKGYIEELEKVSSHFPKFLSVAFTNACNSNCVFCAYKYRRYKPTVIDDELLDKIARDYSAIGGGIIGNSVGLGDPLADPHFWRHLEIVRKYKNISTPIVVTNLIGAKSLDPRRLALEGPTHICVSMGGFNRQDYKLVFGVDCYPDVIESLLTILETRRRAGMPLELSINCRSNLPLRKHFSEPDFKRILEYLDLSAIGFQSRNLDNWTGLITEKDLLPGMTLCKNIKNKRFPCFELYDKLGILPDGRAVACACREANGMSSLVVGNVKTDTLLEIGERVAKMRQDWLKNGNIPPICRGCLGYGVKVIRGAFPDLMAQLRARDEFITAKKQI